MSIVPYLTPEQQKLLETSLLVLDFKIHELGNEPTPPAGLESEELMIRLAELRGKANEISGDCFRIMEAIRTLWRRNYTAPAARKPTIDDLSF
jgi:hypothetical protein